MFKRVQKKSFSYFDIKSAKLYQEANFKVSVLRHEILIKLETAKHFRLSSLTPRTYNGWIPPPIP